MTLSASILSTLSYSDHFNFPLTLEEIHTRLIGVKISPSSLKKALFSLLRSQKIGYARGYYYLPRRSALISRRLQLRELSYPLLARAHVLVTRFSSLSSNILAIYLTGSLAVNNAEGNSDIDLMIITKPNCLWTTRFFLTCYTTLFGLRRTPHSRHNSGKLCLNLYLTPSSFAIPPVKHSLYTAYELIQAVPLYDPNDTHTELLSANTWVKKYLPNFPLPKPQINVPLENRNTGILEYLLYHLQLAYMRPKITREYITPNSAFFHPHDPSPQLNFENQNVETANPLINSVNLKAAT